MRKKRIIIDLSTTIENNANEPSPPEIAYWDHEASAKLRARQLGLKSEDFPDGLGLARESVTLGTHGGTHLDAPYHFGPRVGDKPALTIDQVPLDWCYSDGVVLDLRHKKANETITLGDIKAALDKIKTRDEELTFRGNKTEDYANQFSALSSKKAAELTEKLNGLKIPRLKDLHIKKLVDVMPKTAKEKVP